jgi:diphthine-ammonia ligase
LPSADANSFLSRIQRLDESSHLLHFTNQKKTGSHELNQALIRTQSQALGLPLLQRDFDSCEEMFKKAGLELRAQGERI